MCENKKARSFGSREKYNAVDDGGGWLLKRGKLKLNFITKNANKMQHLQVVEIGFSPMIIFII